MTDQAKYEALIHELLAIIERNKQFFTKANEILAESREQ